MAIDWDTIKEETAVALADALATAQGQAFSTFPMQAVVIEADYAWGGGEIILTNDTSEVTEGTEGTPPEDIPTTPPLEIVATVPPSDIRYGDDGAWFRVAAINPNVSITVEDTFDVGFPTGSGEGASAKAASPIPNAPDSSSLQEKLADPIVNAIFDGVKEALDTAVINDVADDPGNVVGPGVIV